MTDGLPPHDAALERLRSLHPLQIDLSLDRMRRLCAALGDPQDRLPPTIHVAGTNGKGSTIAFIRAMAEAMGLKVHVYTSPHLVRFAERIRVSGALIPEEALTDAIARVERANAGRAITFFEATTAVAFDAFARAPADLCLLEVGMGGRLDATNVIAEPKACAITPVALDHQDFLGSTLAAIAAEKAGILKPEVPAALARQEPAALAVITEIAGRVGAPLLARGDLFDAEVKDGAVRFQWRAEPDLVLPLPTLEGPHQVENAVLAWASLRAAGWAPDASALAQGLTGAVWPARLQRLSTGPLGEAAEAKGAQLFLDGGHNPHGAQALSAALSAMEPVAPLALVVGLLETKDAAGVFAALRPLRAPLHVTGFADAGATPAQVLAETARAQGCDAHAHATLDQALDAALKSGARRVVIFGSLRLAGQVLARDPGLWPR